MGTCIRQACHRDGHTASNATASGWWTTIKEPAQGERGSCGRSSRLRRATASATGWWTIQPRGHCTATQSPTATNAARRTYAGHEKIFAVDKTTENRLGGELRSRQAAGACWRAAPRNPYASAARLPAAGWSWPMFWGVSRTVVRDAHRRSGARRLHIGPRVRGIGTLVNRDVVRVENRMDQAGNSTA